MQYFTAYNEQFDITVIVKLNENMDLELVNWYMGKPDEEITRSYIKEVK